MKPGDAPPRRRGGPHGPAASFGRTALPPPADSFGFPWVYKGMSSPSRERTAVSSRGGLPCCGPAPFTGAPPRVNQEVVKHRWRFCNPNRDLVTPVR